jgi:hypothetical protein
VGVFNELCQFLIIGLLELMKKILSNGSLTKKLAITFCLRVLDGQINEFDDDFLRIERAFGNFSYNTIIAFNRIGRVIQSFQT